jgi:exodeoxyribonuclease-1
MELTHLMNTYLFYDVETSGLNESFDQILQFAAIRTDMTFNELERHEMFVKLRPDVIPSPEASITHRIPLASSMQGVCEVDAVKKIYHLVNQPETISVGYNSLAFDDKFLRFHFHRNLLPPYTHQYLNGCRRMDLLPIVNCYYLYKPKVFKWPEIDGKLTMQLEHLNHANQLAKGTAHNAMVDVEATVELAKRLANQEGKMWQYLATSFEKTVDRQRIENIPITFHSIACSNRVALLIDNEYGVANRYQVPVLLLGNSIPYENQTLWLRLDLPQLRETTATTIVENTRVIRKKYGERGIILPPSERHWQYLSQERRSVVEQNQEWLQSHTELFHKIICYHREFSYPWLPDLDIETALYQTGFLSEEERGLCRQFHATTSVAEKIAIVTQFDNIDLRKLASRLLCRNYAENLPTMLTRDFADYMRRVNPLKEEDALLDYKSNRRTTPRNAWQRLQTLKNEVKQTLKNEVKLDQQQQDLLDELEGYLQRNFFQG